MDTVGFFSSGVQRVYFMAVVEFLFYDLYVGLKVMECVCNCVRCQVCDRFCVWMGTVGCFDLQVLNFFF